MDAVAGVPRLAGWLDRLRPATGRWPWGCGSWPCRCRRRGGRTQNRTAHHNTSLTVTSGCRLSCAKSWLVFLVWCTFLPRHVDTLHIIPAGISHYLARRRTNSLTLPVQLHWNSSQSLRRLDGRTVEIFVLPTWVFARIRPDKKSMKHKDRNGCKCRLNARSYCRPYIPRTNMHNVLFDSSARRRCVIERRRRLAKDSTTWWAHCKKLLEKTCEE